MNTWKMSLVTEDTPNIGMVDKLSSDITNMCVEVLKTCVGVKLADMNDMQKYAVAVSAGCPLDTAQMSNSANTFTFATIPCKIEDDGQGGWLVGWKDHYGRLVLNGLRFPSKEV